MKFNIKIFLCVIVIIGVIAAYFIMSKKDSKPKPAPHPTSKPAPQSASKPAPHTSSHPAPHTSSHPASKPLNKK